MEPIVLKFPINQEFTDNELFDFCAANDWFRIERNKQGQLIIMSPSGGNTGRIHFKIYKFLAQWSIGREDLGYIVDASVGFRLPDKSVLAPDAAFVFKNRWDALTESEQNKFPPLCPDFVIEVRSQSDAITQLKVKMDDWIANGCRLGWLIDPVSQKAWIYSEHGLIKSFDNFDGELDGLDVLPNLSLELKSLL
jgi:Uma2 family endonuclease